MISDSVRQQIFDGSSNDLMDSAFSTLETSRLILRRLCDSDAAPLAAYRSHPDVARYQSWSVFTIEHAAELINSQKSLHPNIIGRWFQFAIELKETGELIGDCGLEIKAHEPSHAEIGFSLAPIFQRHGYAREAVSRMIDYAFVDLHKQRIVALTECHNAGSIKLLEKLGMRREQHFTDVWFKDGWSAEYLYSITGDEWLKSDS